MTLKNKKIQRFISSLLIITVLVPSLLIVSPPKKAEAQFTDFVGAALKTIGNAYTWVNKQATVTNTSISIKNLATEIFRQTLKAIARRALAQMTKSTINWINTGFHGAPLFLENPKSFFGDIASFKIKNLVNVIGYDPNRFPFSKNYLIGVINSYKDTLQDNAQYSFSKITSDPVALRGYRDNFSTGGWEGFLLHTQYTKNNPIGFQIDVNNLLQAELKDEISSVNDLVKQGQGFLSPQVCPTNHQYDNATSPYKRPTFDSKTVPYNPPASNPNLSPAQNQMVLDAYNLTHSVKVDTAQRAFNARVNDCPGGLVNTTPGSVVASSIIKSMNNPQEQASLNVAFGNSMAAIFDSLLNHFLNKGLTALSNHINPTVPDNFDYYGATFSGSNAQTWSSTPDQEVILDDFKKEVSGKTVVIDPTTGVIVQEDIGNTCASTAPPSYCSNTPSIATYVPGAIVNTAFEMTLLDNPDPPNCNVNNTCGLNPGLIQVIDSTVTEAIKLDKCIPGPDKNWEKRLDEERNRIFNTKLATETGHDDPLKSKAATIRASELKFAVSGFKDWVETKMMAALPSSILFIDAIKELDTNAQSDKDLTDKLREKRTALARLKAIEAALAPILTQPPIGSGQEKNLIGIRKQYDAVSASIASVASIDELQSRLDLQKERKQNLLALNNQCTQERIAAGWSIPGGEGARLSNYTPFQYYSFGVDYDPSTSTNATFTAPSLQVYDGVELQTFCSVPIANGYSHGDVIRNDASARYHNCPDGLKFPPLGGTQCNKRGYNITNWFAFRTPYASIGGGPRPPTPGNLFDAGLPGYQDVPLVNTFLVYGDLAGRYPVSVDLDCNLIFNARDVEYRHAGEDAF